MSESIQSGHSQCMLNNVFLDGAPHPLGGMAFQTRLILSVSTFGSCAPKDSAATTRFTMNFIWCYGYWLCLATD